MSTLNIEMPETLCPTANVCRRTLNQFARVRLPITIRPNVSTGTVSTRCSGPPILAPASSSCGGSQDHSCSYTLIQDLRISIPVRFSANVRTGTPSIQCGMPTARNDVDGLAETEEDMEMVYYDTDDIPFEPQNSFPGTSPLMDKGL